MTESSYKENTGGKTHRRHVSLLCVSFASKEGKRYDKKERARRLTYEALVILGVLALLLYLCRLWPLLLLTLLGIFLAAAHCWFSARPRCGRWKPSRRPPGGNAGRTDRKTGSLGIFRSKSPGRWRRTIPAPGGCGKIPIQKRSSSKGTPWEFCSTGREDTGKPPSGWRGTPCPPSNTWAPCRETPAAPTGGGGRGPRTLPKTGTAPAGRYQRPCLSMGGIPLGGAGRPVQRVHRPGAGFSPDFRGELPEPAAWPALCKELCSWGLSCTLREDGVQINFKREDRRKE